MAHIATPDEAASKSRGKVFILWARKFEEATTCIFVAELRQAGFDVKVVGLEGMQTAGLHGLILVADLTLSQALPQVTQVVCIIMPCASARWQRTAADPRVRNFLHRIKATNALIVFSQEVQSAAQGTAGLSYPLTNVTFYPDIDELVDFARGLITQLGR